MLDASGLIEAIHEEVREEAERNLERARREAGAIVARAREEAQTVRAGLLKAAVLEASSRKKQMISAAELEFQRQNLAFRERLLDEAFAAVRRRLSEVTGDESYPDLLERLILEAVTALPGDSVQLLLRKEDLGVITPERLRRIYRRIGEAERPGLALTIRQSPQPISGGCIARSGDGRRVVDNSFERRLERQAPSLRVRMAELLFGGDGAGAS